MGEFRMPALGADMERGKVVEWLVKPGDYVHRGDLVAVVDTEKADIDVETFEEGVVAEILVEVGTTVAVGAPLARITSTPAAVPEGVPELVPAAGAAASPAAEPATEPPHPVHPVSPPIRHLAHEVGVDVALVRGTGKGGAVTRADIERAAAASAESAEPAEPAQTVQPAASAESAEPGHPASARRASSPRARRIAEQLHVDLGVVAGTGPGGAITESDVRVAAAHPAPPTAPARPTTPARPARPAAPERRPAAEPTERAERTERTERTERAAGLRRAIGSLMSRSKKTIPHYYLGTTIDLGAALAWMQEVNSGRPVAQRLVPAALLLKATALAAHENPEVNGFYTDGSFHPSAAVHLGVAVALRQGGLVAPAIHDAEYLSIDALMVQLRDLVARARGGRLQRAEMADPTITVTNLGDLGVETVFGVIYPPQVALVGFGRVTEQPVARNGMLGIRPTATATLSADHRVSDGLRGGRFLARINELLQEPEEL